MRRPYKATRCSTCGSIVYAYVPKTYYASDNAVKALSADGTAVSDAVKDAHFSLKSVTAANLPQFDGVQGLAFSFKGNRPGRYTVKYDYFFQYNSPGTGKNPVTCQNPDCEYYQKEPAYDVGGDHSTHRTENTINLTVTADYKLSYDANGGSGASAAEELKDSTEGSQEFTLSSTVPERKGYSFLGWSENKDAKTADYRAGSKYTLTWPDTAKTLYAVWEKESTTPTNPVNPVTPVNPSTPSEEHTVTFHPANGQPDFTQTVPDGGQAVMPDDPVYNGYKFDGWYTDTDLSKAYDFSTKVNSSLNLYAKWTKSAEPVKPENQAKKVSGILLPKVTAAGKHAQTLTWTAVKNADGYYIYTNRCDKADKEYPFRKAATYKASRARVYKVKKLKTGENYKYYVAAYQIRNGKKVIVRNSVTVHSVAGNTSARSTNVKSVKAKKHSITLKKGRSYTLKASVSKMNKKKAFLDDTHCAKLRFLSGSTSIASVNYNSGKVTAKKAGSTYIYVLGVNGVRDKVKVTVK
ncbi:MAG: InlB B-repeat-containing protein [Candidatus Weimeria sp.]